MRTVSQIELNKYFNAVDALVFTSKSEGSPNVIKEAMASNTPIVTVDVGDVKEVISNAKNCYIVKDTPEEIAEKLFAVLQEGKRTNGRELINHLELSNIAKRVESVYRYVLEDVRNKN
jgi:glycosyltransferase involved in cell wall biosynthesis